MRRTPDCEVASERITTEAYRLGSMDNISAVVLKLNCQGPWTAAQRAQVAVKNLSQRGTRSRRTADDDAADPHGVTVRMQPRPASSEPHGVTVRVQGKEAANGTQ